MAIKISDLKFRYPAEGENGRRNGGSIGMEIEISDLQLPPGKVAVLIGENGLGKTTLLKLLAGILKPLEGSIAAPAQPVLVHQRPYPFSQSVWANVMWPLRIRRVPKIEARRRTEEAIKQVSLTALARRWAPFLSGGEKQRVAIARALVIQPSVLLLDEPTSNIDSLSIQTIERVLKEMAAAGTTVIMSTHNMLSAYRIADYILPMSAGKLTPVMVNIFPGQVIHEESFQGTNNQTQYDHIAKFTIDGGPEIFCPTSEENSTTAVLRMEDVILSREAITTSAQNQFYGIVASLEEVGSELFRVTVDIGVPIMALLTHRSIIELSIQPGAPVHVTFKASAVHLY